ncbi:MAG: histidine phosphatase family protein [Saprospiraceae bacterium]|nr:histidine phosphatase family protein [Saprospiraceae bacterium]
MGMDKTVFIIRHGETECNQMGIVQGCGIDSDLNENGYRQSKLFYQHYKHENFQLIYSSQLKRSYQTVEPFIVDGIPYRQDWRIQEINWGEHEGKRGEPELMMKYQFIIEQWAKGNYHAKPYLGESAAELESRIKMHLEEIENCPESKILICTHGRTLRAMICMLMHLPLSQMENIKQHNTGLYKFRLKKESWEAMELNNLTHLQTVSNLHA